MIERMSICAEQAVKIRNLVKAAGTFPAGGGGGGGAPAASASPWTGDCSTLDTRACEKLRAAKDHTRLMEQHSEILILSTRLGQRLKFIRQTNAERTPRQLSACLRLREIHLIQACGMCMWLCLINFCTFHPTAAPSIRQRCYSLAHSVWRRRTLCSHVPYRSKVARRIISLSDIAN